MQHEPAPAEWALTGPLPKAPPASIALWQEIDDVIHFKGGSTADFPIFFYEL